MANAALLIENMADDGVVGASSQELTMPAANLLTPHVSERWRSKSNNDWFVLDKGSAGLADTLAIAGLTASSSLQARIRLSALDSTGALAEVADSGTLANGSAALDVDYGMLSYLLPAPLAWRYARVDLYDPLASFVEAGAIVAGAREAFTYNFVPGSTILTVDRSRKGTSAGGQTLIWADNKFRRLDLNFDWVAEAQRYGVIERLNRVNGTRKNVLLIVDTDSSNLARDSIFGLVSDPSPVSFGAAIDIFGTQLRIDERL